MRGSSAEKLRGRGSPSCMLENRRQQCIITECRSNGREVDVLNGIRVNALTDDT